MEARQLKAPPVGPYRAEDIAPGEPYELSDGYKIHYTARGPRVARCKSSGFMVLDSDPDAPPAGVDAGVSPVPTMLRAPDIAVGGLANEPGWAPTAPPLCVEYADRGQDEPELQKKIVELLRCGTQLVWVVRLVGPRRVEVHEPGKPMHLAVVGDALEAPGILRNAVPVEALYDREAAHRHTLKNLLQREGYEDLDAVRDEGLKEGRDEGLKEGRDEGLKEGRDEGRREGLRRAIDDLCEVLAIARTAEQSATLDAMSAAALEAVRERIKRERRW